MSQVQADDILRVTVKLSHPVASLIENVWHFLVDGTGFAAAADAVDAVDTFLILVYNTLDALMSDDTTWVDAVIDILTFVIDHWEVTGHVGNIDALTGFTPASGIDVMPPATAHMLRYLTDVPKHEGKKYFAPFTEVVNTDGLITSSLTDLGNLVFLDTLLYEDAIPNSSLTLKGIVLDVNQNIYRFSGSGIQSNRWAQQRRRKKYVGI